MDTATITPGADETGTDELRDELERQQDDLDNDDGRDVGDVGEGDGAGEGDAGTEPGPKPDPDEPDARPSAADDDEPSAAAVETVLRGDGQLGWSVGGKKPTASSLRIGGGKFAVDGQLSKGATHTVVANVTVDKIAFVDKKDAKTGQVTDCERQHNGKIGDGTRLVPAGYRVAILPDDTPELEGEL